MAETVGEAVPVSQRSSWTSFLKSIASFSGDLSSMTAPPFILSPVSLTEFPAYWCEHPALFASIADFPDDPAGRALAILRWFIVTLKGQYTSRNESMGSEKKPLNPVLGELFYGQWAASSLSQGRTDLLVEQVSHHPPITAYVIENKTKGLQLRGHNAQKTSFSGGSIIVKQIGHAILTVNLPGGKKEEYLINFPRLRIDGLWYGSPYIELAETSHIIGGGYVTAIEYKGKGYFTGRSHSFKASVVSAAGGTEDYVVEGTWHLNSKFTKGTHSAFAPPPTKFFHDMSVLPPRHVDTTPLAKMGEWETRRLWGLVAKGIREGDFESASREKGRIEVEQRERRVREKEDGKAWEGWHFERQVTPDPVYERLAGLAKTIPLTEEMYVFKENWPAVFGEDWPSASS